MLQCMHFLCSCWISDEDGAIWAFTAPMIVILLVSHKQLVGLYFKHAYMYAFTYGHPY